MRSRILYLYTKRGLFPAVLSMFAAMAVSASSVPNSQAADEAAKRASQTAISESKAQGTDTARRASIARSYGKLPLTFEVNAGQADGSVKLLSRGDGYTLFIASTEAVLSLRRGSVGEKRELTDGIVKTGESKAAARSVIRLKSIGANPNPKITGMDELPGKSNYFIGNDPGKWHTGIANYAKAKIEDVYPGIDLVYYGNQRQLEYDWILAPGANPEAIRFVVESEADPTIDGQGNLVLDKDGELLLRKPLVYQERNGARTEVAGGFLLLGSRQVGIQVGRYDPRLPLVIDPVLSYSTYLGGSGDDGGFGIALDSARNVYITGFTASADFPTENPYQATNHGGAGNEDAFVTLMNASGTAMIFSTYLGGTGDDGGYGIAVDSFGNAYVTGSTDSTDFPVLNASQGASGGNTDAFVAKINASGVLVGYSTYLGGSGSDGGNGIAVDSAGNAYVTGFAGSTGFPTLNPIQAGNGGGTDAFVTKLNASGDLVYSTYLGGNGYDYPYAIAADPSGSAYIAGMTESTNFPMQNPYQGVSGGNSDAFVSKLNPSGSGWTYSTYLGGSGSDYGYGIAADSSGNAYATGFTLSTNFPVLNAMQSSINGGIDAFVAKLNTSGAPVYSTYLGGNGSDAGRGIAVDSSGNAAITGYTSSTDFPMLNAVQETYGGGVYDAMVAKLNAAGSSLLYSTYLGDSIMDSGIAIAVDAAGDAYVTGGTSSTGFPVINALQSNYGGGGQDAFVAKLAADCTTGAQNLCLVGNRFFVEVDWSTLAGGSGKGNAVPLTSDGGYFWFFENTNVELLVKVKDGRAVNGYFWVFWGAMTDVRYTITIRDTETGAVKKIEGYQGQQVSGNDIRAFQ